MERDVGGRPGVRIGRGTVSARTLTSIFHPSPTRCQDGEKFFYQVAKNFSMGFPIGNFEVIFLLS